MTGLGFSQLPARTRGIGGAVVLLVFLALVYAFVGPAETESPAAGQMDEIRMPVSNPPLEPNRPDLIGEPSVDDLQ